MNPTKHACAHRHAVCIDGNDTSLSSKGMCIVYDHCEQKARMTLTTNMSSTIQLILS